MKFSEGVKDMVRVEMDVYLEVHVEACGVTVCELVCPLIVLSWGVAHYWVYASVVFCESHLKKYGVVRPFLCLVVGNVVGVALIVRADWQLDVVLTCCASDVFHQGEGSKEFNG